MTHSSTEVFNKLHDYYVGRIISQPGLYSQLRCAYHRNHKIPLAVKIISKKKMMEIPKNERIVFNETMLSPLLDHPNIIKIEEVIENETRIFSFMQFAERGDLLMMMRQYSISKSLASSFIDQLLSAVEMIHSIGIVHRDIKLENILVTMNNVIKLCDFGLASITVDGIMTDNCGSYEYSSPESIRCVEFDGFKADMWSVGVVMFALFSKRLPFDDITDDYDYSANEPDFSKIPDRYNEICRRLLSLDPNERPSAAEVRSMLGYKNVKPILSGIDVSGFNSGNMSKLCQTIGIPFREVMADIQSEEFSELKVLATLMNKRTIFRNPDKAVTVPITPKTTIFQRTFETDGCDLMIALKEYLLPKKCNVSSPLSNSPEIVLNGKYQDKRVSFNCVDDVCGCCLLELMPEEGSDDVCRAVMRHLERSFTVSS